MQLELILKYFAAIIEKELGIVYAEHNFFQLQNRLDEIAKLLGVDSIEKLYELALSGMNDQFKQLLFDLATNNETSFYRDQKVFTAFEKVIKPHLLDKSSSITIWSAASSTGQEAVSISILINEISKKLNKKISYSILATDICDKVLNKAETGIYSQLEVQRGLPALLLVKYFTKDDENNWHLIDEIKRSIYFKKQNLRLPFTHAGNFDVIFCRNVLIYQSVEGKKDILHRIIESMNEGGYLILGSGESLLGISEEFEQVSFDGAILYKKLSKDMLKSA